jgi:hypothetical protein
MPPERSEKVIAEAMARAEKVACRPGDGRCYAFPDRLVDALATCTPKGRCKVGWIISKGGRESWDVWLDLETGEGRLWRQAE